MIRFDETVQSPGTEMTEETTEETVDEQAYPSEEEIHQQFEQLEEQPVLDEYDARVGEMREDIPEEDDEVHTEFDPSKEPHVPNEREAEIIEQTPDWDIVGLDPSSVYEMYEAGRISEEQVRGYTARKDFQMNGLMGMRPSRLMTGLEEGWLEERDARAYVDFHNNRPLFAMKDLGKTVYGAVKEGPVKGPFRAWGDLTQWLEHDSPMAQFGEHLSRQVVERMGFTYDETIEEQVMNPRVHPEDVFKVTSEFMEQHLTWLHDIDKRMSTNYTKPGTMLQTIGQFMATYAGIQAVAPSGKVASKLLKSRILRPLYNWSPNTARFTANRLEHTFVKGAMADFIGMEPYEEGLFDMLSEWDRTSQSVLVNAFKTDPSNPAAVERVKQVIEGTLMGGAAEAVFAAFRRVWRGHWASHTNPYEAVDEIDNMVLRNIGEDFLNETDSLYRMKRRDPTNPYGVNPQERPLADVRKNYHTKSRIQVRYKLEGEKGYRSQGFESEDLFDQWRRENADKLTDVQKGYTRQDRGITVEYKVKGDKKYRSRYFDNERELEEWYKRTVNPENDFESGLLRSTEGAGSPNLIRKTVDKPVNEKQPWELTRKEWRKNPQARPDGAVKEDHFVAPAGKPAKWKNEVVDREHYEEIQKAVSRGEPVPEDVLRDYPDLFERVFGRQPGDTLTPRPTEEPTVTSRETTDPPPDRAREVSDGPHIDARKAERPEPGKPYGKRVLKETDEDEIFQDSLALLDGRLPSPEGQPFLERMNIPDAHLRIAENIRSLRVPDMYQMGVADVRSPRPVGAHIPRAAQEEKAANELAKLLSDKPDRVMKRFRRWMGHSDDMTARMYAMRDYLGGYLRDIDQASKNLDQLSPEQVAELGHHMSNIQEIVSMVYGIRSSAGRNLDAFKEMEPVLRQTLDLIRHAKNPADKLKLTKQATGGGNLFLRTYLEYVQGDLLFKPMTQIINMTGSSLALLNERLKRSIGVRLHARKTGVPEFKKELEAQNHGARVGIIEALRVPGFNKKNFYKPQLWGNMWKRAMEEDKEVGSVWRGIATGRHQLDPKAKTTGQTAHSGFKEVERGVGSILDDWGLNTSPWHNYARMTFRGLWQLPFLPFRMLTGGDEFIRSIAHFQEIHAQTARNYVRKAHKEGWDMSDEAIRKDIERQLASSTEDLWVAGREKGRQATFTEDLAKGSRTKAAKKGEELLNTTMGLVFKSQAVPFYRVLINLSKYTGRNSPLGVFSRRQRDKIRAGGIERTEAITGMAGGTALLVSGIALHRMGYLTGRAPTGQKSTWDNVGKQEYSFTTPSMDNYIGYNRFDPAATLLMAGANLSVAYDEMWEYLDEEPDRRVVGDLMSPVMGVISDPIVQKTFMEGMTSQLQMIADFDRSSWGNYFVRQLDMQAPGSTTLKYWQEMQDEVLREMETAKDVYLSRVDSAARLPRRHSWYGDIQKRDPDWPFPGAIRQRIRKDDPVAEWCLALGIPMDPPNDYMTIEGQQVQLTPEEKDRYMQLIEQLPVQEKMTEMVESEYFKNLIPEQQEKVLTRMRDHARDIARKHFIAGETQIQDYVIRQYEEMEKVRKGIKDPDYRVPPSIADFVTD